MLSMFLQTLGDLPTIELGDGSTRGERLALWRTAAGARLRAMAGTFGWRLVDASEVVPLRACALRHVACRHAWGGASISRRS